MLSVTANSVSAPASSAQALSTRQPVSAAEVISTPSSSRSASGYARLVATTPGLDPATLDSTASNTTAAATAPMASAPLIPSSQLLVRKLGLRDRTISPSAT